MSRRCSRPAVRILVLVVCLCLVMPAQATRQQEYNRVVSMVEDVSGCFVLLNTVPLRPLTAPIVHYLPGPDGQTIMAADFAGLVWDKPTRLVLPGIPGLKQVRVGQLQDNPPICRISVSAEQPQLLRQLAFLSTPGSLILKWPGALRGPQAPSRQGKVARPYDQVEASSQAAPPLHLDARMERVVPPAEKEVDSAPQPAPPIVALSMHTLQPVPRPAPSITRRPLPPRTEAGRNVPMVPAAPPRSESQRPVSQPETSTGPAPKRPEPSRILQPQEPTKAPAAKPIEAQSAVPPKETSSVAPVKPQAKSVKTPEIENAGIPPKPAPPISQTLRAAAGAPVPGEAPPAQEMSLISVTNEAGVVRVELKSDRPISANSFRLHEPERHVIDLENFPELLNAPVPPIDTNSCLKAIRTGVPQDDPSKSRLVLDLGANNLNVREERLGNKLAFIIDRPLPGAAILKSARIVLDAGHGGTDPGAQRGDVQEKELTIEITNRLKRILERAGAQITMTRADDSTVSLQDRVTVCNTVSPDIFLSIHINSLETNSSIYGIETYYQTALSKPLAQSIHDALVSKLSEPDRKVRKARFYVINHTPVAAVLAEVGYISNKEERNRLISSEYQEQIAEALAQGIMVYLSRRAELLQSGNTDNKLGTMTDSPQSEKTTGQPSVATAEKRDI